MEPFNFTVGSIIYSVVLKKESPISIAVTHYNLEHVIAKNFYGEWYDDSTNTPLASDTVAEIGKKIDERLRVR